MKIKRVLFITPQIDWPPVSGGMFKTHKMIEGLAKEFQLDIIVLSSVDKICLEHLKQLNVDTVFEFPVEARRRKRSAVNFLKSIFSGIPISVFRVRHEACIDHVLSQHKKYDSLFCDHFTTFQYVEKIVHKCILMHEHNAEYQIWKRMCSETANWLLKCALYFEAARVKYYEKKIGFKCSKVFCVTEADRDFLLSIGNDGRKYKVIPSGGDEALLLSPEICIDKNKFQLVYVGTLTWEANLDGLIWFLEKCWPIVQSKYPSAKLDIIGRNPPSRLINKVLGHAGVKINGYVEDLEPFYRQSRAFIAPIFYGAGIKIKNVNALLRGLPLITTTIGAEGIPIVNGQDFLLADTSEEFTRQIENVFDDPVRAAEIGGNGRRVASKQYRWREIQDKLCDEIRQCVAVL
jgi:glycosyltransferase involved in cell wall biosynthesis